MQPNSARDLEIGIFLSSNTLHTPCMLLQLQDTLIHTHLEANAGRNPSIFTHIIRLQDPSYVNGDKTLNLMETTLYLKCNTNLAWKSTLWLVRVMYLMHALLNNHLNSIFKENGIKPQYKGTHLNT